MLNPETGELIKLSFFARGTARVPDPHAADMGRPPAPNRRYINLDYVEVSPGKFATKERPEPQVIDFHHDLVRACRDGALWAADQPTADACSVKFDPSFGGAIDPKTGKPPISIVPAVFVQPTAPVGDGSKASEVETDAADSIEGLVIPVSSEPGALEPSSR